MRSNSPRLRTLSLTVVVLMAAGAVLPLVGPVTASPARAQLQAMLATAVSSRAYAANVTSLGVAAGANETLANFEITQGDMLIARANEVLSNGVNFTQGVEWARLAMNAYASAAASASLTLRDSGLKLFVDLSSAADAVTEVEATIGLVVSVEAKACSTSSTTGVATAFHQACIRASADLDNATATLRIASGIVSQARLKVNGSVDLSGASVLVARARAAVRSALGEVQTIASFSYFARGQAFLSRVFQPLLAEANSTISLQQSIEASFRSGSSELNATATSQSTAVTLLTASSESVVTLSSSIKTGPLEASGRWAGAVAADVSNNLTSLSLLVSGVLGSNALKNSISGALSADTSFSASVSSYLAAAGLSVPARLESFATYYGSLQADLSQEKAAARKYSVALAAVQGNLSALVTSATVSGLMLTELLSMNVTFGKLGTLVASSTLAFETSGASLLAEAGSVNSAVTTYLGAVNSSSAKILVDVALVNRFDTAAASESSYLNSSTLALFVGASSSVAAAARASANFTAALQQSSKATMGEFASVAGTIATQGNALVAMTRASVRQTEVGIAVLRSDIAARTQLVADANSRISVSLSQFASQDVAGGVSGFEAASVELEAASSAR